MGADDYIPSTFAGDVAPAHTLGIVRAIGSVADQVGVPQGLLSPPIQQHVNGMIGALEAASGLAFGDLLAAGSSVSALIGAGADAQAVVSALSDLVEAGLAIAGEVGEQIGVAAEALAVIPIVGAAIEAAFGVVAWVLEGVTAHETAHAACQNRVLTQVAPQHCRAVIAMANPKRTGPGGTMMPGDLFRLWAYYYSARERFVGWTETYCCSVWNAAPGGERLVPHYPPLNLSSMYVSLCGGYGPLWSEETWQKMIGDYKAGRFSRSFGTGGPNIGMSKGARRRMAKLVRGVMASSTIPGEAGFLSPGVAVPHENGRTIMPILQDFVLKQWQAGHIDRGLVNLLANNLLHRHRVRIECPDLNPSGSPTCCPTGETTCDHAMSWELGSQFEDLIHGWYATLAENFTRNGKWDLAAITPELKLDLHAWSASGSPLLSVSGSVSEGVAAGTDAVLQAADAENSEAGKSRSTRAGVVIGGAGLAAAGLLWWLV